MLELNDNYTTTADVQQYKVFRPTPLNTYSVQLVQTEEDIGIH